MNDSLAADRRRLMVKQIRQEADAVRSLVLVDPSGARLPRWTPGSHIDLMMPEGLARQYSLCGHPAQDRQWRIAVLREPDSRGGSQYVFDGIRPGDLVEVAGPRNHFSLVDAESYCVIAGGIGITPILPMVAALAARGEDWRLVYGGRSLSTMAFLDELAAHNQRVQVVAQDTDGLLDLETIVHQTAAGAAIYCCGPEPLLEAVEKAVAPYGNSRTLHVERFSPVPSGPQDAVEDAFEVVAAKSQRRIPVAPGQSILDALAASGIDVPSSCQEGICGTCETRVLGGDVDHRDSILTQAEQAANKTMFICVSRGSQSELILDV